MATDTEAKSMTIGNAVRSSAQALGDVLCEHPFYTRFMQAYQAAQSDEQAQRLMGEAEALQNRLRFGGSAQDRQHLEEITRLFYELPSVKAYETALDDLRELLVAVDAVISEHAGVAFAENAQRSCCG